MIAAVSALRHCSQRAEQAVTLIINTRREEKYVGVSAVKAVAKIQAPKTVDCDRVAMLIIELAEKVAVRWVKCINAAISEVADQQSVAKLAEIASEHKSPGRVERAMRSKGANQSAS